MKYRPEIDGLRALAVVPVILFHAGFELFSGGFVGVDVFFVISGYLITTILIEDIENKRFSIINFYERRARRILPALFFVILVCILFAWMWMLPSQMKDFSDSIFSVSIFLSNFYFMSQVDYFAPSAELNPLLHTWSLSIEEQFYLFFPPLLLIFFKRSHRFAFFGIICICVVSLLFSEWAWRENQSRNFFFTFSRIWELLAGSTAAFIVQKQGVQKNNPLALLGLAAITFSIFAYDESTPFPSVHALVPVLGVVLLILYADKDTLTAKLLGTKALVGIGLISYSAYLWHQPLLAFARIKSVNEPSHLIMGILALGSLLLAYLSWKYIETPFRNKLAINKAKIFTVSISGILIFSAFGFLGHKKNGFYHRFTEGEQTFLITASSSPLRPQCHFPQELSSLDKKACTYFFDTRSIALVGNSHGTELAYAIAQELKPYNKGVLHHTMSGCNHNYQKSGEEQTVCYRWHEKVVDSLQNDDSIETVVLSYRNETYIENAEYRRSLVKMIESLNEAGKKIVLVLQAPLPGAHINKYLSQFLFNKDIDVKGITNAEWEVIYKGYRSLLEEIPKNTNVINPKDLFCDDVSCHVIKLNEALYFDDDHLSISGASIIARHIISEYIDK
jgi:peptidoglycan/LPS O-acetylase OafA/YrhL